MSFTTLMQIKVNCVPASYSDCGVQSPSHTITVTDEDIKGELRLPLKSAANHHVWQWKRAQSLAVAGVWPKRHKTVDFPPAKIHARPSCRLTIEKGAVKLWHNRNHMWGWNSCFCEAPTELVLPGWLFNKKGFSSVGLVAVATLLSLQSSRALKHSCLLL